ncbi:TIGR03546 family protein [Teredinibacter turnerae]|uniref:TIGR03546 family protein n=1 Tax=Teredinibacter turnerae TaxID=2426 RepID=UPI0003792CCA|nr:TIGR03546 family protein [Teredinibacter turnerae]
MQLLLKFLKALNSEAGPWQIAFGIALGAIVGLTPFFRLHNVIIIFFVLVLRINISSFIASFLLFSGFAYLLDTTMVALGEQVLTAANLQAMWTALYNSPLGPISQFNHTLTMGSLLVSLIAFPVILFASRVGVVLYRNRVLAWVNRFQLVRVLKASKIYHMYQKLEG